MSNFIATQLQAEYSKAQVDRLVDWIGHDADRVDELMSLFLNSDYRMTQWTAWIVGDLGKKRPYLFTPYIPQMLHRARLPDAHDAVKRNVLRVLEVLDLPEEYLDDIADFSFSMLDDPKEAIAIRAFAMTVLTRVCEQVPDLWPELKLVIEKYLVGEVKPAYRVRARAAMEKAKKSRWE